MHIEDWVHAYKLIPFSPKRKIYRKVVMWVEAIRKGRRADKIGTIPINGSHAVELQLDLNIWLQRECFYFNSFEWYVFNFVKSILKEGDIAIDIGANIGYYTTIFSRLVGPSGHVFAFEPSSNFYSQLQQNIALNNDNNISTYKLVVGNDNTPQTLMSGSQSASIVLGDPESEQIVKEVVDTITLDQFIEQHDCPVNLLKIDVNGWDYNVLLGATNLLKVKRPIVIVEVIDWGIIEPLKIYLLMKEHTYNVFFEQDTSVALSASDFNGLIAKIHGLNLICVPIN